MHLLVPIANRSLAHLRFPAGVEEDYWRDRTWAYVPVLRFSVSLILFFYFSYMVLDWWLFRRWIGTGAYLLIWGVASPAALLGIGVTYTEADPRWIRRGIFTATAVNGVALVAAIVLTRMHGAGAIPYEVMLIYMVYVYFLLGTSNRAAMQLAIATAAVYLLASRQTGLAPVLLVDHAVLFVIMISVGALASRIMELSDRKAWLNERRLRELAERDALTGLLNQRAFFEQAESRLSEARVANEEVSVLMLGVRHLRSYNHQLGHPAVDECLRQLAGHLAERVPGSRDLLARLGGEQFALLLHDCRSLDAVRFSEAVCGEIDGLKIPHPGAPHGVVTLVIGICSAHAVDLATARSAAQTADETLLRIRTSGADRVALAVAAENFSLE
ncbi:MAG: GGDEF domain-containing protein [Panacagrimonas sp.]